MHGIGNATNPGSAAGGDPLAKWKSLITDRKKAGNGSWGNRPPKPRPTPMRCTLRRGNSNCPEAATAPQSRQVTAAPASEAG